MDFHHNVFKQIQLKMNTDGQTERQMVQLDNNLYSTYLVSLEEDLLKFKMVKLSFFFFCNITQKAYNTARRMVNIISNVTLIQSPV